jgi:ABC-type uncharacterized transport system substrate-binding protein
LFRDCASLAGSKAATLQSNIARPRDARNGIAKSRPLGGGTVASLAKPGCNVTGFSIQAIELPGKRIELLRAVVPDLHRLAVIANVGYPVAVHEAAEVQAAAHKLGIEIEMLEIRRAEDIAPAFEKLKSGVQAILYVPGCTDKHEYRAYQHIGSGRATPHGSRFP